MMKSAHAISNNYLPQPRDGKKFENLFRSDMQEVAYFSAKITSFCNLVELSLSMNPIINAESILEKCELRSLQ